MSTLKVNNLTDLGDDAIVTAGALVLPAGSVLQVVSVTKTDVSTTTSATFGDISGLTLAITPQSTTSKILMTGMVNMSAGGSDTTTVAGFMRLSRGGTVLAVGDSDGIRVPATGETRGQVQLTESYYAVPLPFNFLDSPGTTSAITYAVQFRADGSRTVAVNRAAVDVNNAISARTVSTLTLMEVSG
jgi:hypothetical protein